MPLGTSNMKGERILKNNFKRGFLSPTRVPGGGKTSSRKGGGTRSYLTEIHSKH